MARTTRTILRILVVEDDQDVRDSIAALLKRDGYRVYPARDESDAARQARLHPPDLILISLVGALDDLLTSARRIRTKGLLEESIPIVIFSISSIPEGTEQNVEGNIHLTSPENFDQLRALLARLLDVPSRR